MNSASFYSGLMSELQKRADMIPPDEHRKKKSTFWNKMLPASLLGAGAGTLGYLGYKSFGNKSGISPVVTSAGTGAVTEAAPQGILAGAAVNPKAPATPGAQAASVLPESSSFNPAEKAYNTALGVDTAYYGLLGGKYLGDATAKFVSGGRGLPTIPYVSKPLGAAMNTYGKDWLAGSKLTTKIPLTATATGALFGVANGVQDLTSGNADYAMKMIGLDPEDHPYAGTVGKYIHAGLPTALALTPHGMVANTIVAGNNAALDVANATQQENVGNAATGLLGIPQAIEAGGGSSQFATVLNTLNKAVNDKQLTPEGFEQLRALFHSSDVTKLSDKVLHPSLMNRAAQHNYQFRNPIGYPFKNPFKSENLFLDDIKEQEMGPSKVVYDRLEKIFGPAPPLEPPPKQFPDQMYPNLFPTKSR